MFMRIIFCAFFFLQAYASDYGIGLHHRGQNILDIGRGAIITKHPIKKGRCYQIDVNQDIEEYPSFGIPPKQNIIQSSPKEVGFDLCVAMYKKYGRLGKDYHKSYEGKLQGKIIYEPLFLDHVLHLAIKLNHPYPFSTCGEVEDCSVIYLHYENSSIMKKLFQLAGTEKEITLYGYFFWRQEGVEMNVLEVHTDNREVVNNKEVTIYHIVLSKETLYSIAKEHKVSVEDLKKANDLKDNTIYVGQELKIP